MKKTHVYFLAPLCGLIIFGLAYWQFSVSYEKREEAALRLKKEHIAEVNRKKQEENLAAIKAALAAQEKRKRDKEAKEKREEAEREARQFALEERNKAIREAAKIEDKVKAIAKDIEGVKKEIANLEAEKKKSIDEEAFLQVYVKQAEENVKSLTGVLTKIQQADEARLAAEKEAAKAAAKK